MMYVNQMSTPKRFEIEVSSWRRLNHPNVVPLYGFVNLEGTLYSVSFMILFCVQLYMGIRSLLGWIMELRPPMWPAFHLQIG